MIRPDSLIGSSQSGTPQELVGAIQWRFESSLPHQQNRKVQGKSASAVQGIRSPCAAAIVVALLVALATPAAAQLPDTGGDSTLAYAKKLLGDRRLPPVVLVTERSPRIPANTEGFHIPGSDKIFIPTYSVVFQRAAAGDRDAAIRLAGILAHEAHHLRFGPDEASAYDAQLDVLQVLGASKDALDRVWASKRAVVKR